MRRPGRKRGTAPVVLTIVAGIMAGLFAAGAAAPTARAQLLEPPRSRQGYYAAVGYHFVLSKAWEDNESWGIWRGTGLSIRFGQMVTRRLGLGLQIHYAGTAGQAQKAALGGLELEGQWEIARNWALHASAGVDVVSLVSDDGRDMTTRGTVGSGYALGVGYDWFFGRRLTGGWAAAPLAQVRFVPGATASGLIGILGVQISYWTGLPRNQLELPPGEAFQPQSK